MTSEYQSPSYPHRRYGMDHDRYAWSPLPFRKPLLWPGGKSIALWITVSLEVFPLNDDGKPFRLPGSMAKPYPDLQNYTWRDYGNRVGVYRLMRAAKRFQLTPDWLVNAAMVNKYPLLLDDILAQGGELIGHGYDMASPHHGQMSERDERELIDACLNVLEGYAGKRPRGWLSPGKSESTLTPEILASAGVDYICDWPNDELPYSFQTKAGQIVSMPHSSELDDRKILIDFRHDEESFVEQVKDYYNYLSREAAVQGGRVMCLNLHPWVTGQSHRIGAVEDVFAFLSSQRDIWPASGGEILDAWKTQAETRP